MVRNKQVKKKCGYGSHKCRRCGSVNAVIRVHGLLYCRRCFREVAPKIGFKKYS